MLNLTKSFKIIEKLPIARYKVIKSNSELDFPFSFYLKIDTAEHKTEKNAVLRCKNKEEAEKNLSFLKKKFQKSEILMQEEVEGIEMILGLKRDKIFGRLFLLGFGGIQAETMNDVAFRALPIDRLEIAKMIKQLKFFPSLIGRKKYALKKFIVLAEKISKLDVAEADFNPVMLNEKDAVIVDARIQA